MIRYCMMPKLILAFTSDDVYEFGEITEQIPRERLKNY